MPLYFTKPRRWPPSKPVQYAVSVIAILAALALLITWLALGFGGNDATQSDSTTDGTEKPVVLPDSAYCMVIIKDVGYERFALVESDPNGGVIEITPMSPTTEFNGTALANILQKQGPIGVTKAIAALTNLPVSHYLSFSIANAENFFTKLGENLSFTLSEEIAYKDDNGATVRLRAESLQLTPKQIAALLQYQQWENAQAYDTICAEITAAVINQCLMPDRSLKGYFELLSNHASTDLRIDHFNAYQTGLEHLASVNDGKIAVISN